MCSGLGKSGGTFGTDTGVFDFFEILNLHVFGFDFLIEFVDFEIKSGVFSGFELESSNVAVHVVFHDGKTVYFFAFFFEFGFGFC